MELIIVDSNIKLANLSGILQGLEIFSYDTETTGLDWTRNKIFVMSFSDGERAWVVPVNRFAYLDIHSFLTKVMSDETKSIIGHNLKFDAHMTYSSFNVEIRRQWHDTLLMAYLMDENRSNALKALMPALLGIKPDDETKIKGWLKANLGKQENWDYSKVPEELMFPYSGTDPWATFKLYEKLKTSIEAHFASLYDNDRQILKILWKLERNGVLVDRPQLQLFYEAQTLEHQQHLDRLFKEVGREFDVNSPDELRKLFYEELGMPVKILTEKGKLPSTDDDALSGMDHPVAGLLQLYRGQTNTINYAKSALEKMDQNGYLHGDYSITRTKTGRFSCSEPNLQNVPKNKLLRSCFIADPGWDMFYFDHAQIEMVGFAHYSRDPKMMAALHAGQDLHQLAAAEVYEIPIENISKEQRQVGKGTNFSIIYGVGKKKLAGYINTYLADRKLNDEEAQKFKEKYFSRFPSVTRFQNEAMNAVRRRREPWGHFIKNQFGRVRRIQDPRNKAYTAVNHLIQGWAPDLMKRGMVKIEKTFQPNWRQNVHDELRVDQKHELTPSQRKEIIHETVKCLTDFPEVRVPVNCKVEWSDKSWADLKLYKEEA